MASETKTDTITIFQTEIPAHGAIIVELAADRCSLKPVTDLSASVAQEFRQHLCSCLDRKPSCICFDFQNVKIIDSQGLSICALVAHSPSITKQVSFEIINSSKQIHNLFKLTRLTKAFHFISEIESENSIQPTAEITTL
ncbi:MAG: STAS domain-containing protein [Chitinivibrionales bacterium]|nr:STAS domain-containing protein [Chitinivibrionales bacterium]